MVTAKYAKTHPETHDGSRGKARLNETLLGLSPCCWFKYSLKISVTVRVWGDG